MKTLSAWTCPTCRTSVATRFCPTCGESPVSPREHTLRGIAERLLQAFTSIDTKTARSIWALLRHPGQLTVSWMRGVRKPYVAPITLFLLVNVLFFAVQSLTGEAVFSSTLDSHLHHQDWQELAGPMVARKLEASGTPLETYAPVFDSAVAVHAKSLIILMTIPFALLLPLVFLRARRPFLTHVVFSLHAYTFLLLFFCLTMLVAQASAWLGYGGLEAPAVDKVLSLVNLAAFGTYLGFAIGPVYGAAGAWRVLQAAVLAIAAAAIVLGYRFALFLITVLTT
jgi:hypothetical protein